MCFHDFFIDITSYSKWLEITKFMDLSEHFRYPFHPQIPRVPKLSKFFQGSLGPERTQMNRSRKNLPGLRIFQGS